MMLLLSLALTAQTADAALPKAAEPNEFYVINDTWADKSKCNRGNAEQIELSTLANDHSAFIGRCVAVTGYLSGSALFPSKDESRTRYAQSAESLKLRRVGLYGLAKASPNAPVKSRRYVVVGLVGDCERLSDSTGMVMGYCHYTNGPYVAVSEFQSAK
jgi:hypothetical protein